MDPTASSAPTSEILGKNVLLVSIGQDRTKFALYQSLHVMGAKLHVLDSPDNALAVELEQMGIITTFLRLNMTNRPTLVNECIRTIDMSDIELEGILTYWDDAVCLAVRLSNHYGLPGNSIESVDKAHDKRLTRVTLQEAGFASPKFHTFNSASSLLDASKGFTFPVILKPLYGAASIGVTKVDSVNDLIPRYNIVSAVLQAELSTGGLMGLTFDSLELATESDVMTFCIEEYLEGPEYDCDIIMSNGEIVYSKAVDNLPLQPPHFCEIMELAPVSRGQVVADRVESFGCAFVKALGLENGVFHVEIIDDRRLGPVIVECNPRVGGGPMRRLHQEMFGVDLAEQALRISLGLPPKLEIRDPGLVKSVSINLHAMSSGHLIEDGINALRFLSEDGSDATYWVCPNSKGDALTGWNLGLPSSMGRVHLLFKDGITSEDAIERANTILNTFHRNLARITHDDNDNPVPPPATDFYTARKLHFKTS